VGIGGISFRPAYACAVGRLALALPLGLGWRRRMPCVDHHARVRCSSCAEPCCCWHAASGSVSTVRAWTVAVCLDGLSWSDYACRAAAHMAQHARRTLRRARRRCAHKTGGPGERTAAMRRHISQRRSVTRRGRRWSACPSWHVRLRGPAMCDCEARPTSGGTHSSSFCFCSPPNSFFSPPTRSGISISGCDSST